MWLYIDNKIMATFQNLRKKKQETQGAQLQRKKENDDDKRIYTQLTRREVGYRASLQRSAAVKEETGGN